MTALADALMKSDSVDPETPQALVEERVWAVAGERLACVNNTEKVRASAFLPELLHRYGRCVPRLVVGMSFLFQFVAQEFRIAVMIRS